MGIMALKDDCCWGCLCWHKLLPPWFWKGELCPLHPLCYLSFVCCRMKWEVRDIGRNSVKRIFLYFSPVNKMQQLNLKFWTVFHEDSPLFVAFRFVCFGMSHRLKNNSFFSRAQLLLIPSNACKHMDLTLWEKDLVVLTIFFFNVLSAAPSMVREDHLCNQGQGCYVWGTCYWWEEQQLKKHLHFCIECR